MERTVSTNYVDQQVGRRVQLYRKAEGLSRSDLCKALDIERDTLKSYELGEERVPASVIINFCLLMQIRPRALFDGMEVMAAEQQLGRRPTRVGWAE